jgi:methylmalonyl-CoA carboxyltransferase small subunit
VKLKVAVDGKTYEVEVEAFEPEPEVPEHLHFGLEPVNMRVPAAPITTLPPASDTASAPVDEAKVCRSPVTGIVVRVVAQVGQALQMGDALLVLEAMKMETSITAPRAGKVAALLVAQGDSVKSGQVLVEFEG